MKRTSIQHILFGLCLNLAIWTSQATDRPVPEVFATIPNQSGGKIMLLTHDRNPNCYGLDGGLSVLSYSSEGDTLEGCWFPLGEDLIKIRWDDGRTKIYPQHALEVTKEFLRWEAEEPALRKKTREHSL